MNILNVVDLRGIPASPYFPTTAVNLKDGVKFTRRLLDGDVPPLVRSRWDAQRLTLEFHRTDTKKSNFSISVKGFTAKHLPYAMVDLSKLPTDVSPAEIFIAQSCTLTIGRIGKDVYFSLHSLQRGNDFTFTMDFNLHSFHPGNFHKMKEYVNFY